MRNIKKLKAILHNQNLLTFLTFGVIFIFSLKGFYGEDIWFHLATGRFIFENRMIPTTDIFSHTAFGQTWIIQGWLADLVNFAVLKFTGEFGLVLFNAVLYTLVFIVLWRVLRLVGDVGKVRGEKIALVLTFIAAWVAIFRFQVRPEPGSYLFLLLLILVLMKFERQMKIILILPAILLIWVNWQAGFVPFGIWAMGILGVRRIIRDYQGVRDLKSIIENVKLVVAILLSLVVILINPSGILGVFYFFGVQPKYLVEDFTEWGSLVIRIGGKESLFNNPDEAIPTVAFLSTLGILSSLSYLWVRKNKLEVNKELGEKLFWPVLVLPFFILTFFANRFASLSVILGSLLVAYFWQSVRVDFEFLNKKITGYVILALCFILLVVRIIISPPAANSYQKANPFRVEVLAFLKENKIEGNVFNMLEDGGYFVWLDPSYKVFMDGRLDVFTRGGIYDDYRKVYAFPPKKEWQEILDKYQIEYLLLPGWQKEPMETIRKSEKYSIVFWSDYLFVMIKNDGVNQVKIEELKLKSILPFNEGDYPKEEVEKAVSEFQKLIKLSPSSSQLATSLGSLYQQEGKIKEAKGEYERAVKLKPEDAIPRLALGSLYFGEKNCTGSLEQFREASKSRGEMIKLYAWRNLGFVYKDCFGDPAMAHFYYKKFLDDSKKTELVKTNIYQEVAGIVYELERRGRR